MNYDTLNTYLQTLLVDQAPSVDYTTILPAAIQDGEGRIYREMDFLATRTVSNALTFTAGSRTLALPTSPSTVIKVLQGVAAISPAGVTAANGTRNQLEEASLDYIDFTWPTESQTGLPDTWAMLDAANIVVKPTPAVSYGVELTGTFTPTPMSATNENSYIGTNYPDLLVAACMTFLTAYQRDWGASSEDPRMGLSWEQHYQTLFKSAYAEEQRRKGDSTGWTPFSETPLATPPRT